MIAGGHGKIALRLGRRLAERGDEVVGMVRNPAHEDDLRAIGVTPATVDLETATVDEVAAILEGADAAVFAAGAGPGSGVARKNTVDRGAATLLATAAERAGVRRYLQISSINVESVRDGATPPGADEVFLAYLRAKLAAEEDLRATGLDWTILRPGSLTDAPGTGRVRLAPKVDLGRVPRDDVADVVVALMDTPESAGLVLELVEGDVPIDEAVRAVTQPGS